MILQHGYQFHTETHPCFPKLAHTYTFAECYNIPASIILCLTFRLEEKSGVCRSVNKNHMKSVSSDQGKNEERKWELVVGLFFLRGEKKKKSLEHLEKTHKTIP